MKKQDESPPDQHATRLEGLDLARYLAFVGMVIVNFKIAMGAEADGGLVSLLTSALEGRAAASFVVLAGIGLGLAADRKLLQTMGVTVRRAVFLMVLGLLNMTIFDADILHYYAVYFFLGLWLLPLRSWWLIGGIIGLNLLFVAMILTLDYDAGWDWDSYSYAGFWTVEGFVRNLFFNGWHPVVPWLGFLLFGIVLSRLTLSERSLQWRLLLGGGLTLMACEALSRFLIPMAALIDPELATLFTTAPVPPMPLYTLAGMGAASLVIGGCLLLENVVRRVGLLACLVPAGRQTLTLYIAHILIGMGTLEALGLLEGQSPQMAVAAALVFCALASAYAFFWAQVFKRGPIEALMRKLAG